MSTTYEIHLYEDNRVWKVVGPFNTYNEASDYRRRHYWIDDDYKIVTRIHLRD